MKDELLQKYAQLIVRTGVNLQKGQILAITSPIECAAFTRMIAEAAYKEGAADVAVNWRDEEFTRIRYLSAPDEVFDDFPLWQQSFYNDYSNKGAAFVSVAAEDPELMKEVLPDRISRYQKARSTSLDVYKEKLMTNRITWSVVSIPTRSWALKVFPGLSAEEAAERLWEEILRTVRVDNNDPVAAWDQHKSNLKKRLDILNSRKLKMLHYRNSLGTDLEIRLPEGHIWLGGSDYTPEGLEFVANMPTEEIFTMPQKSGVNGIVFSSKPLNYNGNLIDKFSITFKDGKAVKYSAEEGEELLKTMIETDEGSHYLGEVALVPYDSPISNSNILFYNTLFDENASCHLALGEAYPVCLKGGADMSREELFKAGANYSLIHVDFMVGTPDLEIVGTTESGEKIKVFENGNFAF